ncbi:MAG: zf-HC2 domain-containing protein [Actinomycetota bacterium]
MNCQGLVELITDYLEGVMPEAERGLVDEHLAGCDGCSTYLEQCRATIRLTGMLTEEQISPDAREVLRGVFRDWQTTG